MSVASSALAGIDGLVEDVSSNVASLKREAGSSSKAAGTAIDSMVTSAIDKGKALRDTLAGARLPGEGWR
jgi:hypothetical protein